MKLTKREESVVQFIRDFIATHGHSPSIREICDGLGLKSPGSLYKVLKSLEGKDILIMDGGRRRTIRLKARTFPGKIRLLGRIAAGRPIEAQQDILEELPCPSEFFGTDRCFALLVQGDSMIERHISPGDIAIIEPDVQPTQGMVAAVMVEDLIPEATLKIVKWDDTAIQLISANPAYPPMHFTGKERLKVKILGKLVGIVRRVSR